MGSVTVSADVLAYTISSLSPSTAYSIKVQALNTALPEPVFSPGNVTLLANTTTPGKPSDPWGIALKDVPTSSNALISWQDASRNGGDPITGYSLSWLPPDGGGTATLLTDVSQYFVENLVPGSRYTFTVIANAGDLSSSPGRARFSFATTPSNSLNDPSGFSQGVPPTSTTFSLKWNKVNNTPNATLSGYVITWQPPDNGGSSNIGSPSAQSATIEGLEFSTQYAFNIYTVSYLGCNVFNSPGNFYVIGSTTADGDPTAPYDLKINKTLSVTVSSVPLEWTAAVPSFGDNIASYTVTAQDISSGYTLPTQSTPVVVGGQNAENTLVFSNLSAGTDYRFSLVATTGFNTVVSGVNPDYIDVQTVPTGGPSDPVLSVVEGSVTTFGMKLVWEPSATNGGTNISSYTLTWNPPTGGGTALINGPTFSNYTYPVTGLLPQTKYTFTMIARNLTNTVSPGNKELAVSTLTLGGPSDPSELSVDPNKSVTASNIPVVWNSASQVPPATIDFYTLFVIGNKYDQTFSTSATKFSISGDLQPDTEYAITIKATNTSNITSPGDGEKLLVRTAALGGPGDPVPLNILRSGTPPPTDSNIAIEWNTANTDGGLDISGYMVSWTPVE